MPRLFCWNFCTGRSGFWSVCPSGRAAQGRGAPYLKRSRLAPPRGSCGIDISGGNRQPSAHEASTPASGSCRQPPHNAGQQRPACQEQRQGCRGATTGDVAAKHSTACRQWSGRSPRLRPDLFRRSMLARPVVVPALPAETAMQKPLPKNGQQNHGKPRLSTKRQTYAETSRFLHGLCHDSGRSLQESYSPHEDQARRPIPARFSTDEQTTENQRAELEAAAATRLESRRDLRGRRHFRQQRTRQAAGLDAMLKDASRRQV